MLTDKNAKDSVGIDHKNILQGLAIKKHVREVSKRDIPLVMQLIKAESMQHFTQSISSQGNKSSKDQIIIVEEVKMSLLAKSCFAPGIISFVSNLIASSEDAEDSDDEEWLQQYKEGMGHEIYRKKLSIQMENRYFSDVVKLIYKRLNAIVFAIDVICNQKTIVRLNPADFLVNNIEENNIYVYCICPGPEIADQIETLDMTKA